MSSSSPSSGIGGGGGGTGGSGSGGRLSSAAKRRRRRPPQHYNVTTSIEERLIHHAIQNSKLDKGRPVDGKLRSVPMGPTFYPTQEEFEGNPIDYIKRIRPIAEKYGICKIVPPPGWNPPLGIDFDSSKRFQTKLQYLHRLQEGISFGDGVEYTTEEYQRVASFRAKEWKTKHYPDHDLITRHADAIQREQKEQQQQQEESKTTDETGANTAGTGSTNLLDVDDKRYTIENLERDYWNIVETHSMEVAVEYGNDVDTAVFGAGFPLSERGRSISGNGGTKHPEKLNEPEPAFGTEDYYKETWWNLNNVPCAPDSVLGHVRVGINGINVPWLYFGSLFTTFCWHNEDNYLYSINYHHRGAPKLWYGVPGTKEAAEGLEKVFKSYLSMKMRDIPDLLHHITTMFSPRLLQNSGVPVYREVQYEGEFIVTFPRAFHSGFSLGPNIGEAVNFASSEWISYGADANERYRSFGRPAVFSHDRLTFTMANHLEEQTAYSTCRLLLDELERIVQEELQLRQDLLKTGVRDVSHLIKLPKNRLDQLDEKSASYDDKRLCHACKHVCFFSAVACECSQSRVSCLRHSHYMCRCPPQRRYFMFWSKNDELNSTLDRVRQHCSYLKALNPVTADSVKSSAPLPEKPADTAAEGVDAAPGSTEDRMRHKNDEIYTDPVTLESLRKRLQGASSPQNGVEEKGQEATETTAPQHSSPSQAEKGLQLANSVDEDEEDLFS